MKEKILNKATELFTRLGFKSGTMDDIAQELGISKKTIYTHFPNKSKLVESCAKDLFCNISDGVAEIINKNHNPIKEHFLIHKYALNKLKEEKESTQHQLRKYYPKIEQKMRKQKLELMRKQVINNLKRGKKQGYYRDDIDIEVVFQFYYMTLEGIKNSDIFSVKKYTIPFILKHFLEYHFRAIASEKGLTYINHLKNKDL
ncbi:TetR/AcrR family transcriptional regulator [Mesonia aquimarina]|uniref:TetR/AcrR family transcriptional regulator n=1 Tax=Mesonia aquimarina TaxID=1504967 RepID=UPI0013CEA5E2|nr:TetR/AcrR family transcriptional regulator [Mesonia aquimarina]